MTAACPPPRALCKRPQAKQCVDPMPAQPVYAIGCIMRVDVPSGFSSLVIAPSYQPVTLMVSIIKSLIAIIVCGAIGGVAAWWLTGALGLDGTVGALVAAAVGMVVAVGTFAAITSLLRAVGWMK